MSLYPRRGLLPFLVLGWLCLPGPVQATGGIKDGAGFFSADARNKAEDAIDEIHHRTHKDVLIETIRKLPAEKLKEYCALKNDAEQARFFQNLAVEHASRAKVDGVYVLLCRVPAVDEPKQGLFHWPGRVINLVLPPQVVGRAVVVWPPGRNDAYFPQEARAALDDKLRRLKEVDQKKDAILLDAVTFTGAELEANARALGAPPPERFRWTNVAWAAAALVGAWAVLGVVRTRVAARQGTPGPTAGASPVQTALFGTAGAFWLFGAYRAGREESAAAPVPQPAEPAAEAVPDGPLMHPDDVEALARGPASWAPEETEAATGHDLT
jgi:hypothetical protein